MRTYSARIITLCLIAAFWGLGMEAKGGSSSWQQGDSKGVSLAAVTLTC